MPPMIQAVLDYCDSHQGPKGEEVCRKFNFVGYNLGRRGQPPVPCPADCTRLHAQVPPELVLNEHGKPRVWEGPVPTVKAVPKAPKK